MSHYSKYLCCFLIICISACQSLSAEDKQQTQPTQLILEDHVLNDKIYDVNNNVFIDKDELFNKILTSKYILLGETHDNIRHHENQAWVIDFLASQSYSTSVSFEMIDDSQYDFIANKNIKTADELIDLLNQNSAGWQYKTYYKELFESVLQAGFKINSGNIEHRKLYDILRQSNGELPANIEQLMSQLSLTQVMKNDLAKEIVESHCGMIDQEQAKPMIQGQQIRDASMALSLLNRDTSKRVLIAGSGHVRKDRGVPIYLSSQEKEAKIVVVAMLEVEQNVIDLASYLASQEANELPFDYVWYTARAAREDPCLHFKKTSK